MWQCTYDVNIRVNAFKFKNELACPYINTLCHSCNEGTISIFISTINSGCESVLDMHFRHIELARPVASEAATQ